MTGCYVLKNIIKFEVSISAIIFLHINLVEKHTYKHGEFCASVTAH